MVLLPPGVFSIMYEHAVMYFTTRPVGIPTVLATVMIVSCHVKVKCLARRDFAGEGRAASCSPSSFCTLGMGRWADEVLVRNRIITMIFLCKLQGTG